jgi:hypothetical protein
MFSQLELTTRMKLTTHSNARGARLLLAASALLLAIGATAHAQWQTSTYTLKGGWNAINLTGDASYDTIENIMPSSVIEVWRWNPNPNQVQFTSSPLIPTEGTPEWNVWKRVGGGNTLSLMTGPASYLVRCAGTTANTYSIPIKQSPKPPRTSWVRNGANLNGFSTFKNGANFPTFSNYFATFPTAIAPSTKIYKYVGGDLGPGNPLQVFSPTAERVDRNQAYWFSAEVVGDFAAPLQFSFTSADGLSFGRTGTSVTARIYNRSDAVVTVTFTPANSETEPASQPSITGPAPLTRRVFNTTTLVNEDVPITGAITEVLAPKATTTVTFGINRAAMTGAANALYASLLRVTDSSNLMDLYLPVSAQKDTLAGLWIGDISVNGVGSQVAGATGTTTQREFPLRTLLHVTDTGTPRLLSQVFLGQLAAPGNDAGVCTTEALLKQDAKAFAQRFVATHMPLNQVITGTGGLTGLPGTVSCTITIPFNDPTNPFVHQYHPDHDNKDARFQPVGAGVESYNITRTCTFTFTASPPPGGTTIGWGSSVIGGTYAETITGIHKNPITVSGTFELRRASEIGTLSQ